MVGIPGHYKSNRSISFVELRGFRNMRLAAARSTGSEDEDSEEEEGEEVACDDWERYPKRELGLADGLRLQAAGDGLSILPMQYSYFEAGQRHPRQRI